jgi:hypothetical protein
MPRGGRNSGVYAVRVGRKPGIYSNWPECQAQVKGFPGAKFKKFESQIEACEFVANRSSSLLNSTAPAQVEFKCDSGKIELKVVARNTVPAPDPQTSALSLNNSANNISSSRLQDSKENEALSEGAKQPRRSIGNKRRLGHRQRVRRRRKLSGSGVVQAVATPKSREIKPESSL